MTSSTSRLLPLYFVILSPIHLLRFAAKCVTLAGYAIWGIVMVTLP